MTTYDVIIVGAGAGGGVAAGVLAEAGKRVLLLERGRDLSFKDIPRDHLRNHRFTRHGHNTGPDLDGNPRVFVDNNDVEHVISPHDDDYQNNAMTVGGGTRVFGAQAWRFLPTDFAMASTYGVPPGSSLADWPISYNDLAPYYQRAEWEIGVAGDSAASARIWQREREFPMPAVPLNRQGAVLRRGADALGWHTFGVPLLINSVRYGGRPACIQCQHCVGFGCPVDAKNGTRTTMIPRALASGRCELISQAFVERIDSDGDGHVSGVTYIDADSRRHSPRAEVVICAGGAIETARLLLNSAAGTALMGLAIGTIKLGGTCRATTTPARLACCPNLFTMGWGRA